jgi:hypothetical protein
MIEAIFFLFIYVSTDKKGEKAKKKEKRQARDKLAKTIRQKNLGGGYLPYRIVGTSMSMYKYQRTEKNYLPFVWYHTNRGL